MSSPLRGGGPQEFIFLMGPLKAKSYGIPLRETELPTLPFPAGIKQRQHLPKQPNIAALQERNHLPGNNATIRHIVTILISLKSDSIADSLIETRCNGPMGEGL
jgi:hypothetical protein